MFIINLGFGRFWLSARLLVGQISPAVLIPLMVTSLIVLRELGMTRVGED